jgi:non-heme chloroperoxidase
VTSDPVLPRRVELPVPSGVVIAGDAYGDPGATPVVFLHGGGQTRNAWGSTAQAVAEAGYHALSLDHRGHGESGWHPEGDYTIDGFVDDLIAVVATLGDRPYLVGASLGGITALLAETRGAASISRGVVLVDVTPRLEIPGIKRILGFMAARPDGFASLDEAADFVAAYLTDRPRPRDTSGLAKNLRLGPDGRYRWHWDPRLMKLWSPSRFDPNEAQRIIAERLDAARRLRVPALLVRGRMSDVVSEEGAREFLEAAPHAEYVDLEAAGHMVAGDRNDAFTGAVLDFLRRASGS